MAEKEVIKVGRPIYPGEKESFPRKRSFGKLTSLLGAFPEK